MKPEVMGNVEDNERVRCKMLRNIGRLPRRLAADRGLSPIVAANETSSGSSVYQANYDQK